MLEKKITFAELKAKLDTFTPEQLAHRVMWGGEDRGGYVGEVHVFEDDQVNPSGDGWENAADYRKQLLEDGETEAEADDIVAAEIVLHKGSPVLFVDVPAEKFRAGDVVLHRPSGETWLLAYANLERNEVSACGWPRSCAKADDCVMVRAASDEKHEDMLRTWANKMPQSLDGDDYDHRIGECKRQLDELAARKKIAVTQAAMERWSAGHDERQQTEAQRRSRARSAKRRRERHQESLWESGRPRVATPAACRCAQRGSHVLLCAMPGRGGARDAAPGSLRPLMGMTVNNPGVQGPLMEALDKVKGCGPSREFSLVRTKIEEALLWLKAAERGDAF